MTPLKVISIFVFSTEISLSVPAKCVCGCMMLPMEINSKCMHELTALARSLPFPLKPSMSEVFPGPRTNYLQPSAMPAAKVIM